MPQFASFVVRAEREQSLTSRQSKITMRDMARMNIARRPLIGNRSRARSLMYS
jgi:hypothetical protein